MATLDQRQALSKAKIGLMSENNTVFFSTVCLSLRHIWDETVPTAATNGERILYNPDFFMSLTPPQRVGLLLHETLHVALMHMVRLGDRDITRFNIAADYAVNLIIDKAGIALPPAALLDYAYDGMSAEEIYELLAEDVQDNPGGIGLDLDTPEEGANGSNKAEISRISAQLDDILVQAAIQSQAQGDKPGSIPLEAARYIDKLLNPVVPWFQVLRSFMTKMAKTDYSFRKPNRRFFPKHILPSLHGEAMCDIAIAIDTSGSVTDHQFQCFVSETGTIIKELRPEKTTFMQFTTRITASDELHNLNDLKHVTFAESGGTNVNPVIEWAAQTKPTCLIVFTDGYFSEVKINPHVPVIWIIYDNDGFKAPFGKVIHYQFKEQK